ncbi:MAG: phosphate/phosphite/phosphonate ABC transporter substrate-binding protein [Gammaproteobacteria bacterium]|nr:phosphate/phosphite/phosphonate ABC transporter substrate-binding protein [Gammaproteobacteria bacterium]
MNQWTTKIFSTVLFITTLCLSTALQATEYFLAVQPILPEAELKKSYQPLADYLSAETGHTISISTKRNFLFYWTKMRKREKGFDFVLDAAHFTDYRIKKQGYTVLAKLPDTVSFSIVSSEDSFILDIEELIGLRVATMPSPSLGALRLEELFTNPMRIPMYIWEINTTVAVEKLQNGELDAAIIPTRLASTYSNLNIVMTTEPVPHMGLSASPDVPQDVREKVRQALLNAHQTETGKAMLAELKTEKFDPASSETYDGYSDLLKDVFGY